MQYGGWSRTERLIALAEEHREDLVRIRDMAYHAQRHWFGRRKALMEIEVWAQVSLETPRQDALDPPASGD